MLAWPSRNRHLLGQNGRELLGATAWSAIAKACAAANAFVTIPFAIDALSPAQFGIWATLVSLATFAGFLDFGVSNGTMNLIAGAVGRGRYDEASAIFRISAALLLRLSLGVGGILIAALLAVDWGSLIGVAEPTSSETLAAFAVLFATVVTSVYLNLGYKVLLALGLPGQTYRWQAAGQLLALLTVVVAALNGVSLPGLVAAALASPLVASGACLLKARRKLPSTPLDAPIDRVLARRTIITEGGYFFLMQMATALAFWADAMIVAATAGPETAGTYAVLQRVFSVIPLALGLVWGPLWPMYRRMLAAGELTSAKRINRVFLHVSVLYSTMASITLLLFLPQCLQALGIQSRSLPILLIIGFALWSILESIGTSIGTFLNSASLVRLQIPFALTFATGTLVSKLILAQSGHYALMPIATSAWYCATCVMPYFLLRKKILTNLESTRL